MPKCTVLVGGVYLCKLKQSEERNELFELSFLFVKLAHPAYNVKISSAVCCAMSSRFNAVPWEGDSMPLAQKLNAFTAEEYLLWEEAADVKHDYISGEVFAHAGARDSHVTVAMNLSLLLLSHLRGKPCRVYMAEMKVRVEEADAFFYPDVFVTCDPRDSESPLYKSHPSIIVEILSDSTASYDYGKKFAVYRTIESLNEYILVDPDTFSAECFRKDSTGHWVLYPVSKGERFEIPELGFSVPLEELYGNVNVSNDTGRE